MIWPSPFRHRIVASSLCMIYPAHVAWRKGLYGLSVWYGITGGLSAIYWFNPTDVLRLCDRINATGIILAHHVYLYYLPPSPYKIVYIANSCMGMMCYMGSRKNCQNACIASRYHLLFHFLGNTANLWMYFFLL